MSTLNFITVILVLLFIAGCVITGICLAIEFIKYLYNSWKRWRDSPETSYIFSLFVVWIICALVAWIIYPIKLLVKILCLIISCYIIALQIKRSKKERKQEKERLARIASEPSSLSREEIIATPLFQESLHELINTHRWMTLADAKHSYGYSPPSVFSPRQKPHTIEFKKTWCDLWLENLKQYHNGQTWPEREVGLNKFAVDLFGENAEEMKKIINIEYIADHLIELERPNDWDSDYTLRCDVIVHNCREWNYREDIRELYIECLEKAIYQKK